MKLLTCIALQYNKTPLYQHTALMALMIAFHVFSSVLWCQLLFQSKNKMNCELMLIYDTPAYMFNVYKNQQSRQTGSRNLTGPKHFPQYGIPIWSLWPNIRFLPSIVSEKNVTKNILDRRKDRGKTVYPLPVERGYKKRCSVCLYSHLFCQ